MQLHWIPNFLTVARIALVPVFVIALAKQAYDVALIVFFVAGLSDLLDGWLARQFGWQSRLGSLLDPIADKLLFAAAMLMLAGQSLIPWWLALLVICRDLIIVSGATVYNFVVEKLSGAASWLGKLNSAVLGLYVLAVLAEAGNLGQFQSAIATLQWAVLVIVLGSGLHYIWFWARQATRRRLSRETFQ